MKRRRVYAFDAQYQNKLAERALFAGRPGRRGRSRWPPADFWAWAQTFTASYLVGVPVRAGWLLLATGCVTWAWIGWNARLGQRRIAWMSVGSLLTAAVALWRWLE